MEEELEGRRFSQKRRPDLQRQDANYANSHELGNRLARVAGLVAGVPREDQRLDASEDVLDSVAERPDPLLGTGMRVA